jgi:hypothetical protein
MGPRGASSGPEGTARAAGRVARCTGDAAAISVHRMALRGATSIGVTRPSSTGSPLMVALANTQLGKLLNDGNMQIYCWLNGGGNISTNTVRPGGNWPGPRHR